MRLTVLPDILAICRLRPDHEIPSWAFQNRSFMSVTYTDDELSIVCSADAVPRDIRQQTGWRAFKVCGPLDFALTGVLSGLAAPLADAGISVLAVSTFDTDYLMVRDSALEAAQALLADAGHEITPFTP
ncbi:MAG: ACT domain-containing protein [Clostridia bacterium]